MNTCASTDGARRAQNCAVFASVCIVVVHAIGHSALKVVEVVREDVRSVP